LKIENTLKIDAPRSRVFAALIDPAVLQKCIPGCEEMVSTGENRYNAKLTAGVGPVKGVFTATVSLQDIVAPEHYTIAVEGKGRKGDPRPLRTPGEYWEYNDVRVNRLSLALLRRFRRPLPDSSFPVSMAVPQLSHGISHPTCPAAYTRFTPSNSEQRLHPLSYRGCWHRVSRCLLRRYRHRFGY